MNCESPENIGLDHGGCDAGNLSPVWREGRGAGGEDQEDGMLGQDRLKTILCALLKSSDEYGLKKSTKYLAREYCVRFLKNNPLFLTHDAELLMISSLHLAVKFNQNIQISSQYTIQCCVTQSQDAYSHQQFLDFQLHLLKSLHYNLCYTSPYDQLDQLTSTLNLAPLEYDLVQAAIDFVISLDEYAHASGEEILSVCFVSIFLQRKISSLRLFNYLQSLYKKNPEIHAMGILIRDAIFSAEEDEFDDFPTHNQ